MAKAFDYSKWDNIEISDDEEDCHPNIDKASWFRMKHRSRVEREDLEAHEKAQMEAEIAAATKRLAELKKEETKEATRAEKKELEAKIKEKRERIEYMEANKKWNVDNICHTAAEKTIISSKQSEDAAALKEGSLIRGDRPENTTKIGPESEKASVMSYAKFVETHETELEDFIALIALDDVRDALHKNGSVLLHEHAQSYLLLSCLEDEMNGFPDKMRRAARNSQILSHITELGQSMRRHPRDVVLPFFSRIAEPVYRRGFDEAVDGFVKRIQARAVEKRKEMAAKDGENQVEEVPREERLGPGGLDPVEVFESLPKAMQEAFEAKDTQMLQVALESMPLQEAKRHMERCEASGLWVSQAKNDKDDPGASALDEDDDDFEEEDIDEKTAPEEDDDDVVESAAAADDKKKVTPTSA